MSSSRIFADVRPSTPRFRVVASSKSAWTAWQMGTSHQRDTTQRDSASRLDIATRILRPQRLCDVADREALTRLQSELLAGAESRYGRPRSRHSVKSMMATVYAALHWAETQGWLQAVPRIQLVKTAKVRSMKGRPVTAEEFERLLDKTATITGNDIAESWRFLLRGLWDSGLRLEELLSVSWDDPNCIMPVWHGHRFPVLHVPAALQKNDTDEEIPLLPWFDALLRSVPHDDRCGWVFNPVSLQGRIGRSAKPGRLNPDWCGKIITRIGRAANVVVHPGDPAIGRPAKFCSAHDLRRSCAERLVDAGVPEREVQRVMRHASFETTRRYYSAGTVQRSAAVLNKKIQLYPGTISAGDDVNPSALLAQLDRASDS